jgi:alpha-ribazole phosphatase
MQVYVVRHTAVTISPGICYGITDVPLADTFASDAKRVISMLPSMPDQVFSSPLQRCISLASLISAKKVEVTNSLLEMNFGNWEGKNWDAIHPTDLNLWMQNYTDTPPPGGETLSEMAERVYLFMDSLRIKQLDSVILVTHAGVLRCIWAWLLKIPLTEIFRIKVDFGSVLHFQMAADEVNDKLLSFINPVVAEQK